MKKLITILVLLISGAIHAQEFNFSCEVIDPNSQVIDLSPISGQLTAAGVEGNDFRLILPPNVRPGSYSFLTDHNVYPFNNGGRSSLISVRRDANNVVTGIDITAASSTGAVIRMVLDDAPELELIQQAAMVIRVSRGQYNNIVLDYDILYDVEGLPKFTTSPSSGNLLIGGDVRYNPATLNAERVFNIVDGVIYHNTKIVNYTSNTANRILDIASVGESPVDFLKRSHDLFAIGLPIFYSGRSGETAFYATEADLFTKAHDDNSNMSVVDLTPLSVIDGFNTRNDFTTTSRSSLFVTRGQAIAGEWYAIKTSDRAEVVEIVSVTQDISGKDFAIFDGSDLTASIPSGTAVNVWQISDPSIHGIVKVDASVVVEDYRGYYDLRGFNWTDSTHFDNFNGGGTTNHGPYYNHIEEDAASGAVFTRSYEYTTRRGALFDASFAVDVFGTTAGRVAVMRSSQYPQGWGLYISTGGAGGYYRSLWYSHDLAHRWDHGFNNDFEAKRHGYKLPTNAGFLR